MDDNSLQPGVDDQFLVAMGLSGLQGEEKQEALDDILYTLNIRVGQRVADSLSEEQVAEFDKFTPGTDNQVIADWLKQNIPNYQQIVDEEATKMRDEAQASTDQVMQNLGF